MFSACPQCWTFRAVGLVCGKADEFYGELALRKVAAISESSDLATLMQVAEDLELIASKVTA